MQLPADLSTWLTLIGSGSTGLGSILLAWRVKAILDWAVNCLTAHDESITQLRLLVSNRTQTGPIVEGATKHLLDIRAKLGVKLLVLGFLCLAAGMFCNVASYLLVKGG